MNLDIHGEIEALKALEKLTKLEDGLTADFAEWGQETLDGDLYGTSNYAPPLAGSKYVRTGNLGSNWGLRRPGKMSVAFVNNSDYAGYVVGDSEGAGQAALHAGRWWIALKRIEEKIPLLIEKIEKRVT